MFNANPFAPGRNTQSSRRNARGRGWHKKGYRDMGNMWINIRRGSYGHTRGMEVNESSTIEEFWEQAVRSIKMEDGFPIPEDWSFDVSSNRQSIEPSDDLITTLFDGGENVYVKIYDEAGDERVYDFGTDVWGYHTPGRRY